MTTVLKILESLDHEDGLDVGKLERTLKITKKFDKDNLNIAAVYILVVNKIFQALFLR